MGRISTLFVHKIVRIATGGEPVRSRALCQSVGVDPDQPAEPGEMIGDDAFFGLLERIAGEEPDGRSVAVRVGATMRCDDYGAFGLAFKSAVDLRGAYARVERYGRVVTNIANFELLSREDGGAFMAVLEGGEPRLGLQMTNELAVAAAVALSREVSSGGFIPNELCFSHQAPEDLSAYAEHFQCPLRFGAKRGGIEVSEAHLQTPNHLGDPGISSFFDTHLDRELSALAEDEALDQRVRLQISQSLSEGVPTISVVAGRLGLSGRTLQRRLAEQGHAYQDLVDAARRDLAERLLRRTDYALAEIAFLTGFSEQSTFTRAFKRWSGQTPAHYRRST